VTSTLLELVGLALIADGADALWGRGVALLVGGVLLLLLGSLTDDVAVRLALRRGVRATRVWWSRRAEDEPRVSPHPPLNLTPEDDEEAHRLAEAVARRLSSVS
jgi:hypothetical protein